MSSNPNPNINIPSNTKYIGGALFVIVLISLVAGIAIVLYFANRPDPLNSEIINERKAKLAEVNSKQDELINNYAWIDQAKGIVRIPIQQSMKLTVEELHNPKAFMQKMASESAQESAQKKTPKSTDKEETVKKTESKDKESKDQKSEEKESSKEAKKEEAVKKPESQGSKDQKSEQKETSKSANKEEAGKKPESQETKAQKSEQKEEPSKGANKEESSKKPESQETKGQEPVQKSESKNANILLPES